MIAANPNWKGGRRVNSSSAVAGSDCFGFRLIDAEKAENPAHLEGPGDKVGWLDQFCAAADFGRHPKRIYDGPDPR